MSPPDCLSCGACCREAFDCTPLEPDEVTRLLLQAPSHVETHDDGWSQLTRVPSPLHAAGTWCAALQFDADGDSSYKCRIYAIRPDACRLLDAGSESCHLARRRVGLEPWLPEERPHGPLFC